MYVGIGISISDIGIGVGSAGVSVLVAAILVLLLVSISPISVSVNRPVVSNCVVGDSRGIACLSYCILHRLSLESTRFLNLCCRRFPCCGPMGICCCWN